MQGVCIGVACVHRSGPEDHRAPGRLWVSAVSWQNYQAPLPLGGSGWGGKWCVLEVHRGDGPGTGGTRGMWVSLVHRWVSVRGIQINTWGFKWGHGPSDLDSSGFCAGVRVPERQGLGLHPGMGVSASIWAPRGLSWGGGMFQRTGTPTWYHRPPQASPRPGSPSRGK